MFKNLLLGVVSLLWLINPRVTTMTKHQLEQTAANVINAYQQLEHIQIKASLIRRWETSTSSGEHHYVVMVDMELDKSHVVVYDVKLSLDIPIEEFTKKRGQKLIRKTHRDDNDSCLYGSFTRDSWIGKKGSLPPFSQWIEGGHFIGHETIMGNVCAVFLYIREERDTEYYRREDKLFVDTETWLISKWEYAVYNQENSNKPWMVSTKVFGNIVVKPEQILKQGGTP